MERKIIHQLFYKKLLEKIMSGEWGIGYKFPGERSLCEMYNISRTTVREALKNLEIEGYIERKQGDGSYVIFDEKSRKVKKLYTIRDKFKEKFIKQEVKLIDFSIQKCGNKYCKKLNLSPSDDVIKITRVFIAEDIPFTVEYSYLPRKFFNTMTRDMVEKDGLYNTLTTLGHKPTRAEENVLAVDMNSQEIKLLELPKKYLAIEANRKTYSGDIIIEYTRDIIRNDYFVYTVYIDG